MMKGFIGYPIAAIALAALPKAAQAEDLALEPSSPWQIDYADDSCALRRSFGDGDKPVHLELRRYEPDGEFHATIATARFRVREHATARFRVRERGLSLQLEPYPLELKDIEARPIVYEKSGLHGYRFFLRTGVHPETDSGVRTLTSEADSHIRVAAIRGIRVSNGFSEDFVLRTGPLDAAMDAMRACTDELLTHWGLDADANRNLVRKVTPIDLAEWTKPIQENYPRDAVRDGEQADLSVRMTVSTEGVPLSCTVQTGLGSDRFEDEACMQLMEHARFMPALDAAGVPVASYWVANLLYRLK